MFNQNDPPLVSVIILNFNGATYIEDCLFSVLDTKYPNFEVIFVDNASTDSSLKIVEKTFGNDQRLRIFKSIQNLGFSAGNNFGFSHAKGEYIAFLNNDIIADPNWLFSLVDAVENDPTIGLAGSTILSIDGKKLRGGGGLWSDYLQFLYPLGVGRGGDFEFIPIFEVSFASGCSLIASRKTLDEIGLFDPVIPFFYDDTLLALKAWLAGKRVVTVTSSRIRHIGGASTTKFWKNYLVTFSLLRAKMCLLFDLNFNYKDLLKALMIVHFSIAMELMFSIRQKNLPQVLGNMRASAWVIKNFEHVWKNRLQHWSNAKISPETLLKKYIRIKLRFPLCSIPSQLRYSIYHNECMKYEKTLIRD